MALSDEEITHGQKCLQIWQRFTSLPMVSHHAKFAKAIEKEARKDDEALIRQMLAALEGYRRNHNDHQPCDAEKAARARLLDSDLSTLTDRGAKAWAGVDPQKLREGGAL